MKKKITENKIQIADNVCGGSVCNDGEFARWLKVFCKNQMSLT